ncbi:sensor histidine kinase [Pseudoduganella aquatica]|nr:ATP-binding protein [Pseudoduganella aquatica]
MRQQERLRERQRIARILHDNFLQQCQCVQLALERQVEQCDFASQDKAALLRLANQANEAMAEGRALILQLRQDGHTACLGQRVDALGAMLLRLRPAKFSCRLRPALYCLRDAYSDELYMLLAEAIRNAFMHSAATHIWVADFGCQADLSVAVGDDGVGLGGASMDNADSARHYGLLGMQERARLLGASLSLDSPTSGGTTVSLHLKRAGWA